jgi:hypothetical protein
LDLENVSRFPAAWTVGLRPDGRETLVVVAKATFLIPDGSDVPSLADEQIPLTTADEFTGEPGLSAPLRESDFAPAKPRCDVLLVGKAYAPGGRPAPRVPVGLKVGGMQKKFDVVGHRGWFRSLGWVSATDPLPFTTLPVGYDQAFGGRDLSDEDPAKHRWYSLNHAGVGFHTNLAAKAIQLKPLPHTEERADPVRRPDGKYRPMAFGPLGRAWSPRRELVGTYDQRWVDEVCPFLPADFREDYYQSAPPDQQIPHLRGGERVELLNLTPAGFTSFSLPPLELPVAFYPKDGAKERVLAAADTLFLEPERGLFTVTWRATRPLRRNAFELAGVVLGKTSRAWERARDLGKTYYPSLAHVRRAQAEEGS